VRGGEEAQDKTTHRGLYENRDELHKKLILYETWRDFIPATFTAEGKGALGITNDIF